MKGKEFFSQLYKHSPSKNNTIWEQECNCQDMVHLNKIELFFQDELGLLFEVANKTEQIIPIIHAHFDEVIEWKNKSKTIQDKEIFSYLLFTWGIDAVTQLNVQGEFIYCYDIFMKSALGQTYKNGEEYDLSAIKPYEFLNSKNKYLANSRSVIEQWFSQLYYYSKSFSGLNEWCEYFFEDIYYDLNENLNIDLYHPQFLSNLFSWCEINSNWKGVFAIRKIIEREYNLIRWTNGSNLKETKYSLGLQLLLIKNYKNQEKPQLYNELELNHGFGPFAKVQAVIGLCVDEYSLVSNLELLLLSINEFNNFLATQKLTSIDYVYRRARLFKTLLNNPILIAADIGRSDIIETILKHYYDIQFPLNEGNTLFIIPNQLNKVSYCFNRRQILDNKGTQRIITKLVDIKNKAFNQFLVLKGGVKQDFNITGKDVGMINLKYAKEFEDKLYELYDFRKIEKDIHLLDSMCQFDLNSFPLQALMIKSIQNTLPINLSISKKLEFPKVQKVLFWSGFSLTSQIEAESLKKIFDHGTVQFEMHSEQESTMEVFINRIDRFDPEIVWISSHGEYQHYEPNLSDIKFTEDDSLGIRDFIKLENNGKKRRLLFLNICEGGIHSQIGEFKNLGFPNLLTSSNQDVLSHLWMVETNFAYVFGALIAIGITLKNLNYIEAFSYAMNLVLISKEKILDELNNIPVNLFELKERVKNNEGTEWGNLITTGSPAYYI